MNERRRLLAAKRWILCLLLLMVFTVPAAAQPVADVPGALAEIVLRNWSSWNGGGAATNIAQLETALRRRDIRGEDAAVLASLVEKMRDAGGDAVSLVTVLVWVEQDRGLQYRCLKRMIFAQEGERPVFARKTPAFAALQEESRGNGAIVSAMGALAANRPQEIKAAIRLLPGEQYEVRFPGGEKTAGRLPSEGELLTGGLMLALGDGTWPALLYAAFEKALGPTATPQAVQALWSGRAPQVRQLAGGDSAWVRRLLQEALGSGRMVQAVLGEKPASPIPGLEYGQTYAVLRFDAQADEVTLWHPNAASFDPGGPEGAGSGYLITAGVLQMPLRDLTANFSALVVESKR